MGTGLILGTQLHSGDAGKIRHPGVKLPVTVDRLSGRQLKCGRFRSGRLGDGTSGSTRSRPEQGGQRKDGKENEFLHCCSRLPMTGGTARRLAKSA